MFHESELGFSAKTPKDKKELKEEYEENKLTARRALEKTMRPELINRLDSIQVFHALTYQNVEKIFDNLIEDLKKRLATQNVGLKIDEKVKKHLIEKGFDPKNGARPLRRAIEDELESILSEAIIKEELSKGQIATITISKNQLKLKVENE